jgi:hypothetical protein
MSLTYRLAAIDELGAPFRERMFELMRRHYLGVNADDFRRDLEEKDRAIVLEDAATGELCGFSTQKLYTVHDGGQSVRVVFSGDTIIDPAHWGSQQLPLGFGRMMLSILDQLPAVPLYWLLISKGHRTYRYLPVFFRAFDPCCSAPTPAVTQALMDHLARAKFGAAYDAERGLVRATAQAQCLRPALAAVETWRVRKDPHVAYFLQRNPDYHRGDELVCLARFERSNLKPFILRQLEPRVLSGV